MNKVKFCKDCKWSESDPHSSWTLRCKNPEVNKNDEWALAYASFIGSNCNEERKKTWLSFPACGKTGKLWELRLESDPKL